MGEWLADFSMAFMMCAIVLGLGYLIVDGIMRGWA